MKRIRILSFGSMCVFRVGGMVAAAGGRAAHE
jgi:hypothetical protein